MGVEYPIDCDNLTAHQPQHDYPSSSISPTPSYSSVAFQPLSLSIAMLRSDGVVEVLPLPVSSSRKINPLCITPDTMSNDPHKGEDGLCLIAHGKSKLAC